MANSEVVIVGPGELPLIADLYNEIFRPPRNVEFFRRRLLGRYNPLLLLANLDGRPVGFSTGFELKPTVFFGWLLGVQSEVRREGIAAQLHEAQSAWAAEHGYESIRMECHNAHRAILHMAIEMNFNIVGMRWDSDRQDNLIIFEKQLTDQAPRED
ncbi:MAG TPA: GNAT family N-acetyltransferase [Phycisphaerae bacterium]|nr:GNAT family N-acetyltransferase [Phycisphaerae bacterium]